MSVFGSVVSVCLLALSIVVVWSSSSSQRWLLVVMALCLRLLLTAAVLTLAAAAVLPDRLLEYGLAEETRQTLGWLRQYCGRDFRLAVGVAAFGLAAAGLPGLICLDFARALVAHAAWLRRVHSRPLPAQSAQRSAAASTPRPAPPTAPAKSPKRQSLDELLR